MQSNIVGALKSKRCKAGLVGLIVASSAIIGTTSASADTYKMECSPYYAGIELCVSYDWTDGFVSVEGYNNNDPSSYFFDDSMTLSWGTGPNTSTLVEQENWYGHTWFSYGEYIGHDPGHTCAAFRDAGALLNYYCYNF
jgi:hypothetical protein